MQGKRFTEVHGHKIAYHVTGSGEPLILVHGVATYSFIWRDVALELAKKFKVYSIDLLGCGDSDKPVFSDFSVSGQADLIHSFLLENDISNVHFVGHDIGGGIGQILAVRYPAMVKSLILVNPVGYDLWPIQPIKGMRIPIIREIGLAAFDHGLLKFLVRRGLFHKELATDELLELFKSTLQTREGRQGFLRLVHSLDNKDLTAISEAIKTIRAPTLIIRGEEDAYLSPEISIRLNQDISDSRIESISSAGHYIQIDEPDRVARLILAFIKEKTGLEVAHGRRKRDIPAQA